MIKGAQKRDSNMGNLIIVQKFFNRDALEETAVFVSLWGLPFVPKVRLSLGQILLSLHS